MNETLFDLVFHHVTKGVAGLVLAYMWFSWYSKSIVPWMKAGEDDGEESNASSRSIEFPFATMLIMFGLSAGYVYYVTTEAAYRDTNAISSDVSDQEMESIRQRVENYEPPAPEESGPTLDDKVRAQEERTKERNEAAKEAFRKLGETAEVDEGAAEQE